MAKREEGKRPDRDYEVGYGKPPASRRFKPGQSGNPSGRPKKRKTVGEAFNEAFSERVALIVSGREVRMPRREVMLLALMGKAMKGDIAAASLIFKLRDKFSADPAANIEETNLSPGELKMMEGYFDRNKQGSKEDAATGDEKDNPSNA